MDIYSKGYRTITTSVNHTKIIKEMAMTYFSISGSLLGKKKNKKVDIMKVTGIMKKLHVMQQLNFIWCFLICQSSCISDFWINEKLLHAEAEGDNQSLTAESSINTYL